MLEVDVIATVDPAMSTGTEAGVTVPELAVMLAVWLEGSAPAEKLTVTSPLSSATPLDADSTTDATPTFEWSAVSGATSYQIQVDGDPGFSSPDIDDTTTAGTTYTPSSALSVATYYWRVRASNTCGDGPWSASRSCQILEEIFLPLIWKGY